MFDEQLKASYVWQGIKTFTDLRSAASNADLVVEAATENKEIKLNLFKSFKRVL